MFKIITFGYVAALLFFIFSASYNTEIKTNNTSQAELLKKLREEIETENDLKEAQRNRWKDEFNRFGTLNSGGHRFSGCAKEMKIALDKTSFSAVKITSMTVFVSSNKGVTDFEEYQIRCNLSNKKLEFYAYWNTKNPSNLYFQNIAELWQIVEKRLASDIIKRVSSCFSKASKTAGGHIDESIIIGNAKMSCSNLVNFYSINAYDKLNN